MTSRALIAALAFAAASLGAQAAHAAPQHATPRAAQGETIVEPVLFPGKLEFPLPNGAQRPPDCGFPSTLTSETGVDLTCLVTHDEDFGVGLISWLGQHGWRRGAALIGGVSAVREDENGCIDSLGIFPHDVDGATGIWFSLTQTPTCETSPAR